MNKKTAGTDVLKILISFVNPYKSWLVISVVSLIVNVFVNIYIGYLMANIIDIILFRTRDPVKIIAYSVAVIAAGAVSRFFLKYSCGKIAAFTVRDIRHVVSQHIERLKVSSIDTHHSGENISRVTNNATVIQNFLQNSFANIFYNPIIFIGTFIYIFIISWRLLLACTLVFLVIIVLSAMMSKPMQAKAAQLMRHLGKANAVAQDAIWGFPLLKSFNMKDILYGKFKKSMEMVLYNGLSIEKILAVITPIRIMLQALPNMICIIYGGFLIVNKQLTPGGLLTLIYLLQFLIGAAVSFPQLIAELQRTLGAAKHLFEVLEEPVESRESGTPTKEDSNVTIACEHVTFAYDGQNKVLEDLSFTLNGNEVTALVGPSGNGKSTIFKLLCGFYEPLCGCIKLFGIPLEDWGLDEARKQISIVSQDAYIFPASIAENIAYGRPDATMEEIYAAAKAADAHDFILALPDGYHTHSGERGAKLSGGQKQRISLARAILKDAPIIALDEPTSALDSKSEAAVLDALKNNIKNKTVFIIAHRLSTIVNADKILVLDHGTIVEEGTHTQLLLSEGIYRQLYLNRFIPVNSNNVEGELYA